MRATLTPLAVDILGVADALSVRPSLVRQWVRQGSMPKPVEIGGQQRWVLADLQQWIEAQRDTINQE